MARSISEAVKMAMDGQTDDEEVIEPVESETADPPVEDASPSEASVDPVSDDDTTEEPTESPEPEVIPAPVGFTDDERKWFADLSPEMQRAVARRESDRDSDYTRKSQELAEKSALADRLDSVLAPHRQAWQLRGMTEDQAIGQLLAAQRMLEANPTQALRYLAQQYGADLQQITKAQANVNPQIAALQNEIAQLRDGMTQRERQTHQQQIQAVERSIETWATEAGSDGQPLRPHFNAVKAHMEALVPRIKRDSPHLGNADILNQAYDQAVFADPKIRDVMIDQRVRAEQAKRNGAAKAKAAKARVASSSISSDGGEAPAVSGKMTAGQAVAAAFAEAAGNERV